MFSTTFFLFLPINNMCEKGNIRRGMFNNMEKKLKVYFRHFRQTEKFLTRFEKEKIHYNINLEKLLILIKIEGANSR